MNYKSICFTFILSVLSCVLAETNEIKKVEDANIIPLILRFIIFPRRIFPNIPFAVEVVDSNVLKALKSTNSDPKATLALLCGASYLQYWPDVLLDKIQYLVLTALFVGIQLCSLQATVESGGNIYSTSVSVTVSGSPFGGDLNEADSQQSAEFAQLNSDLGKFIQYK